MTIISRFQPVVSSSDLDYMWSQLRDETGLTDEAESQARFKSLKQSTVFSGLFRVLFDSTVFRYYRMTYERESRRKDVEKAQSSQQSLVEEGVAEPDRDLVVASERLLQPPPGERATALPSASQSSLQDKDDLQSQPTLPNTIYGPRFKSTMEEESDEISPEDVEGKEAYAVSGVGGSGLPQATAAPQGCRRRHL